MFWTNDKCFVKPKSTPSVQPLITYGKNLTKSNATGKGNKYPDTIERKIDPGMANV